MAARPAEAERPAYPHATARWEARVVCADGSLRARHRFWLPKEAGEAEAKARALEIWTEARNWPVSVEVERIGVFPCASSIAVERAA